jgi:hypothetical protein
MLSGMRLRHRRRRRTAGNPYRHWLRLLVVVLAVVVTIASIVGYIVLSFTINGVPAYQLSTGWVAVLQPVTAPNVDTVQLLVEARTQGGQTRCL